MVDNLDIKQNLIQLGLSDKEAEVYIQMLDSEASILEISKAINIPRTTVYRICESLVDKKFAEWIISDRGNMIKARKPESLDFLIKEQESRLEKTKSSINNLSEMIQTTTQKLPKTQVRYYKGQEGLKQIVWNTLKAKREIIGYSEFGRIDIVGEKFYNKYVAEFNLRKLEDRVISNQKCYEYYQKYIVGQSEKDTKHQINLGGIRIIDEKTFYVSGDHSIYNDTYAISYWNQGEVVGVEIENKELVEMHKSIFKILWQIAKPLD